MSTTRCPEGHLFSPRRHGNICPYCSKTVLLSSKSNSSDDDDYGRLYEESAYMDDLGVMDPVTGWLVCIEGASKGRDYRIRTEKNFIGRSDGMDIQILGDNNVAKKNHAIIVYDPKKRQTLLLPGDSKGLVYYNDEAIYAPTELSPYDTIEVGNSKFIFISLCGENFEWPELDGVADKAEKDDI